MGEGSVRPSAAMRLLLIDSGRSLAAALEAPLAAEFADVPVVVEVTGGRVAVDLLRSSPFDVVAADLGTLADLCERPEERIGKLARASADALVLVLSEECSISFSLSAMRAGAHDCAARHLDGAALVTRIGELARRHGKSRALTRTNPEPELSAVPPPVSVPSIPVMRDLVLPMWRQEQKIIENAIMNFAGNVALAAAALELSPSTIYRKRQAWAELDSRRMELASVRARY
jgi:DNA-binding NarL/FixJ family response regulator